MSLGNVILNRVFYFGTGFLTNTRKKVLGVNEDILKLETKSCTLFSWLACVTVRVAVVHLWLT